MRSANTSKSKVDLVLTSPRDGEYYRCEYNDATAVSVSGRGEADEADCDRWRVFWFPSFWPVRPAGKIYNVKLL